jgi:hypothetical protein
VSRRLIAPLVALAAVLLPSLASADTARIIVGGNGEGEVIFRDNDCVVYFDRRGRESDKGARCTRSQVLQANEAMDRYRRDQGLDRRGEDRGDDRNPVVRVNGDGSSRVEIGSCRVQYDRRGRRIGNPRDCSSRQLEQADRAMETYRREQGTDRPGRGDDDGTPRVSMNSDGSGRVDIGDCRVQYDRRGRRIGSPRDCSSRQLVRADTAMETHRREQGVDGERPSYGVGGSGSLRGETTFSADGGVVRFSSTGCSVRFDKEGIRQDSSGRCSDAQQREAEKIFNKARILRQSIDQKGSGA